MNMLINSVPDGLKIAGTEYKYILTLAYGLSLRNYYLMKAKTLIKLFQI